MNANSQEFLETTKATKEQEMRSATFCVLVSLFVYFVVMNHGVMASPQPGQPDAENLLTQGKKHITEGHFSEAVAAFNQYKQSAPNDPRPYFFSGIALAESGRLSAAAAELSEAVRLAPDQPEYILSHANVLTLLGHKSQAIKELSVFKKDEVANRLTTEGVWQLGDVYFRLEMAQDALRILELLAKRDPKDPSIDLLRGKVYKLIGNLDLAQQSFEKSLESISESSTAYNKAPAFFELGKVLQQRNEIPVSKKAFLEALKLSPGNPEILHALGTVCLAMNEVDEAIQYLEKAEPAGANFPQIYYALGQAYQRKGDLAKGAKYLNLKKAQEINLAKRKKEILEHEELTLTTLGEEKLGQGYEAEARALFEQVLLANPNNWQANQYLAEMTLDSGNFLLARKYLVKLEEVDPDSADGIYLMASYWYKSNQFERARSYAERGKAVQPGHAELRNLLGNIYLKLDQKDRALEEYSAALKSSPNRSDFRANYRAAGGK